MAERVAGAGGTAPERIILRPPLWRLMQVSCAAGERRQKKPEKTWIEPRPAWLERRGGYTPCPMPRNLGEMHTQLKEAAVTRLLNSRVHRGLGNLLFDDYRFWIGGELEISRFAMCRACRQAMTGVEPRRDHFEHYKCSLWMVEAIKELAKEKICVVCEKKHCTDWTWGLPLCEEGCRRRWMFETQPFPLWQVALEEVRPKVQQRMDEAKKLWEATWDKE